MPLSAARREMLKRWASEKRARAKPAKKGEPKPGSSTQGKED